MDEICIVLMGSSTTDCLGLEDDFDPFEWCWH